VIFWSARCPDETLSGQQILRTRFARRSDTHTPPVKATR
jgi:hypothetical protein